MKSSFSRMLFPAALILLLTMLVVGMSLQFLIWGFFRQSTFDALVNDGKVISHLAAAYGVPDGLPRGEFLLNLSVASQVDNVDAVICDTAGRLLLCSDAPLGCGHQGMVIERSFLEQVYEKEVITRTGIIENLYQDVRYVAAVRIDEPVTGLPAGVVIISSPTAQTNAILSRIANIYLFVSVLVVVIALALMALFAKRQVKPLRQIARTASAFGHGKLDARVTVDDNFTVEMQELASAFNNMAVSLEKSEYQRQEFVANVSHELKTPMTVISGYVDGILDNTIPPERQRYYMELVSQETKRLSRLVRSMLDISRLQDQDIPDASRLRFDICETVGQVLITFEQKINNKHLNVHVNIPDFPVYTRANPDAITQVVYNLVDNAVKFCPEGQDLSLRVRTGLEKLYVSVSNQGETIPPEELPLVFDRFHKLDKARSSDQEGWGLGLYIVKTLICAHGEDISVSSRNGVTEFTFTLPLVN